MFLKNGEGTLNPLALQRQKVSFPLILKDFICSLHLNFVLYSLKEINFLVVSVCVGHYLLRINLFMSHGFSTIIQIFKDLDTIS